MLHRGPILLILPLWLLACGSVPPLRTLSTPAGELFIDNFEKRSGVAETPHSLTLTTFNAGLAQGVIPHADERAPAIVAALAKLNSDVLCVQEFWRERDFDALAQAVPRLSYVERPKPDANASGGSCTRADIAPGFACVRRSCGDRVGRALTSCAVRSCARFAFALPTDCRSCLTRDPMRSPDQIVKDCVGPDGAQKSVKTRGFFYGGSFGIGLLSAYEPRERDLLRLPSEQHPRGVIYMRLKPPGFDELHVFCTHLTPVMASIPYPGSGSWEQEQANQVRRLIRWIDDKAGALGGVVLIGDLNTGPAVASRILPRQPASYDKIIGLGLSSPFLERGQCTFCYDNPLQRRRRPTGLLIDHVLVRGVGSASRARRVLDGPVVLDGEVGKIRTAYSDHYGISVSVDR